MSFIKFYCYECERKVLDSMKKTEKAMSTGQIAEATVIDRKEIDKTMKTLKTSGKIESSIIFY